MPVLEVATKSDFVTALKTTTKEQDFVFVDFFAKWCGPCRRIAPKIHEFSTTYPKVKFLQVDVDKCPELATDFGITAMPTFMFFRSGSNTVLDTIVGANTEKIEIILKHISEMPQEIEESDDSDDNGDNGSPGSDESQGGDSSTCSADSMPELVDSDHEQQVEPSLDL